MPQITIIISLPFTSVIILMMMLMDKKKEIITIKKKKNTESQKYRKEILEK